MFTDLVGSTATAQRDEKSALARQSEQERLLRPAFGRHGGREVKSTGDGFLVEFDSALAATECAVDVQQALRDRNSAGASEPLLVRIGIHLGDVEERDGDIYGDAVNIASRVEPFADPGGICVSEPVYVQIRNKVPFSLEGLGPKPLRGVRESVELFRVAVSAALPARPPNAPAPRIAVLPLANISPDPDNEYFADGLTEELITVLSQIKGLRVISRTSVSQYKGTKKPVAQIGAELGADSVLEGSVRRAGDHLRIAVQLIDTRSDEHRWAQTYDRKLENVFAIQADVAERAAGALQVELLQSERTAIQEPPTASLEAYDAFLRGVQGTQLYGAMTGRELDLKTERCFESAIALDPRYAAAYARLAGHLIRVMGETRTSAEVVPRVRELVAKALELSPGSSESYTVRGAVAMQIDHDWHRAEADFQKAIALNPSNSDARQHYAHLLAVLQRYEEAEQQDRKALEENPLSYLTRYALATIRAAQGDLEGATGLLARIAEDIPDAPTVHAVRAVLYAVAGKVPEARSAAEPLAKRSDPESREGYAVALALTGEPGPAQALLKDPKLAGNRPLRYGAVLHAAIGEDGPALDLLERDAQEGDNALWSVYSLPVFDRIRDDPRFVALLRAQGLPTTLRRQFRFRPPYLAH